MSSATIFVVLKVLDGLLMLADKGVDLVSAIKATKSKMEHWRDTGHNPTNAEWDAALDERNDDIDALVKRAKET